MKSAKFPRLAAALASAAIAATTAGAAQAGDVVVDIAGVKGVGGPLYVRLQTKDQFMGAESDYRATVEAPDVGSLSVSIKNVPPGQFAVSVWHDSNNNGAFDADSFGRPLDGWSISGAPSTMGPPSFDTAKVDVSPNGVTVSMRMIYPN